MMIGNENRMMVIGEDDEILVDDVIFNKCLIVGKCKMWCGYWIGSYIVFIKNVNNVLYYIFIRI